VSLRINLLAVLIALGSMSARVPLDADDLEEGDFAASGTAVLPPDIEIFPAAVTVVAGESFEFKLSGSKHLSPDDVVWAVESDGGEIFRGLYQASNTPGTYKISATYRHFLSNDTLPRGRRAMLVGCSASEQERLSSVPGSDPQTVGHAFAMVTVTAATFQIVPAWASASTETTIFFNTVSNVGTNENVYWRLEEETVGDLYVSGNIGVPKIAEYTTPVFPGVYHLHATRTDRPDLQASVAVTVTTNSPLP
jgi:hypothetical protein